MKPIGIVALLTVVSFTSVASAADKKKCLDSAPRGQELRDQGKLLEARERFIVCADPACPPPVPTYCTEWLEDVKKKIPSIAIRVTDSGGSDVTDATVTLDGRPVLADGHSIDVDPGSHLLHVTRSGAKDADQTVVAAAGEHGRVVLVKLETEAAASKTTAPTAMSSDRFFKMAPLGSWIGWGVGAVGILGFGVLGTKANIEYGDYKSSCGTHCTPADRDDVKDTMVIADAFLVVGLVGAAIGTVVYLLTPPSVEQRAHATMGAKSMGLRW